MAVIARVGCISKSYLIVVDPPVRDSDPLDLHRLDWIVVDLFTDLADGRILASQTPGNHLQERSLASLTYGRMRVHKVENVWQLVWHFLHTNV